MRVLLIDNYDSYTHNVAQLIEMVTGEAPSVWPNDDDRLVALDEDRFDALVISPGPGRPQVATDLGHVMAVLSRTTLPVLGICLGHQAIAHHSGGLVGPAPQPQHGKVERVRHAGDALFAGVPEEFAAVRYHSLSASDLPDEIEATAWSADGVVMALRHRVSPWWGVQFHPESIASEHGGQLVANFLELAREARVPQQPSPASPALPESGWGVAYIEVASPVGTDVLVRELYPQASPSFWLDSSTQAYGSGRFSFIGDASGPLSEVITYRAGRGAVKVAEGEALRVESGTVFDVLERRLAQRRVDVTDLPFDFQGGYVGYLGYEMKADCGAGPGRHESPDPDAVWMFADRLLVADHHTGHTFVVYVHDGSSEHRDAGAEWARRTADRIAALAQRSDVEPVSTSSTSPATPTGPGPHALQQAMVRGPEQYQQDVVRCQELLAQGESYEICLTDNLHLPFHREDLDYYLELRRANPAPYAALLRLDDLTVFCSSPERFLTVDRARRVESKPIKGTARRDSDPVVDDRIARDLAADPKTRAENLMIVDLLRNDLGQVCRAGSIGVDPFMAVESYQTVHQLVSTVSGELRPDVSAVQCLRHCFPGGSMTGAPKLRTMQLIDDLEEEPRGVYAGTIGMLGLGGTADLNIVIRTAVRHGDAITVGAGGAIVLDSDPADELAEMLLKAGAPLRPLPADAVGSPRSHPDERTYA